MDDYFRKVHSQTDSRMWINNPTTEETGLALGEDAFGCTTNPAFCARLIKEDQDYVDGVIDGLTGDIKDYDFLASEVHRICVKRVMDAFMPVFEKSGGTKGFVTLQDDPRCDHDAEFIIGNLEKNKKLAPNYMAKIPVIEGGIQAIEECVRQNIPICATEVFAISQALCIAERYAKACERYGNTPPIFITHITGIFDEYLKITAKRERIGIAPEIIDQAGICIARKEFRLFREYGYNVTMMGGGARGPHHFTEIVGGPHITINWSTVREILDGGYEASETVEGETPEDVFAELSEKLPDFRLAYDDDGLSVEEFAGYGPVQLFRNMFIRGWHLLLAQIAYRKHMSAR